MVRVHLFEIENLGTALKQSLAQFRFLTSLWQALKFTNGHSLFVQYPGKPVVTTDCFTAIKTKILFFPVFRKRKIIVHIQEPVQERNKVRSS